MRSSLLRVATTIVVGLLVSACASPASPPPATSPPPTSAPSAASLVRTPPPTSPPPAVSPPITAISAGSSHTCALTRGGGVKCWGANANGQLGDGTTTDSYVPVDVAGLASGVSAIAAGAYQTCALMSSGGVRCWGANATGQLGDGTTTDRSVPVDVAGLASGVSAISVGGNHTCTLTRGGGVKCWGANGNGQLGGRATTQSSVPVDVSGLASGVRAVAAGASHTCVLTSGGGVKCWGANSYYQLGNGTFTDSFVPVDVTGLAGGVSAIAAGGDITCVLTSVGDVKCWGPNDNGRLGNGTTTLTSVPVDVVGLAGGVTAIAAGGTCALTSVGGVRCWGANGSGSLVPVEVSDLASGVTAVAVGGDHTCALLNGGRVRCWGANEYGQLGNGRPCSSLSSSSVAVDVDFAASSSASKPTGTPVGAIEHATGPADVVLRFDYGPDLGASELTGEYFQPGPEFTLYGDGTVIFRNDLAQGPLTDGPIIRASPFMIVNLDEDQIQ
jgi:alpha-tubulin suppressor-like RCC1 family protein